jgi:hypothetical protein
MKRLSGSAAHMKTVKRAPLTTATQALEDVRAKQHCSEPFVP